MYIHMNEKQDQSVNARVDALNMCQYCVCVSYIHKRMHTHTYAHTHTCTHTQEHSNNLPFISVSPSQAQVGQGVGKVLVSHLL